MFIFIPAPVVAALTFPGIILHEMAHKFFCDYFNVKVFKVAYFRISSQAGHVIHEPVYNCNQNAIIALAPLLVNSLACLMLLSPYFIITNLGTSCLWKVSSLDVFLIWVGLSCGLSALPSSTDVRNISKYVDMKYKFVKSIVVFLNALGFVGELIWLLILWGITIPIVGVVNFLIV